MSRLFNKTSRQVGAAPGTLVYIGVQKSAEVRISLLSFRMNEVMKALTIIATILVPSTLWPAFMG